MPKSTATCNSIINLMYRAAAWANVADNAAASGSASTAALVLARPLFQITLGVASLMVEKDLLNQIPSLPIIKDQACLGVLIGAGAAVAASTTFAGQVESVWG